ncbi:MAG: N-6 DNA methylase [Pirellulaceae bacterium]|nr:N-6 DNA methylase [Pirellulaceae bacterium]
MQGRELAAVGFTTRSQVAVDGLVPTRAALTDLPWHEAAVVLAARAFEPVDFVFFRRFEDGRSSHPAAFVIDNTQQRFSAEELARTHHELWLQAATPLIYVAWPSRVDVLSCARGPDFWIDGQREYRPAEQLDVASRVNSELARLRRLSASGLADGTFWEEPQNQRLANHAAAAHESLIRSVVETDKALGGEQDPVARRLLLLTVLVKYLEDRDVFPRPGWFGRFRQGARSFLDLLRGENPAEVTALLRALESKFNGDIFCLPDESRLTRATLRRLVRLVEARTLGSQRYLWDLYSFGHLPVEVVSHLYQRFVQGSTAVYTPPFLADLLLDYLMPYDQLAGHERVLDPACGSGVFLVGAFRRLVNAWRARHEWRTPDVETLKSILREQIFGVETQADAVDLSAFSLSLAVCDSLQPNVIWRELRFDRLRGANLQQRDFFEETPPASTGQATPAERFDLIVGNPPFESQFSDAAGRVNEQHVAQRGRIPGRQIAYRFLDHCLRMLSELGRLCLIQPAGFLYNLQSHSFRSYVANTGRIEALLDFTSIRGLYEGADPKTIAVVIGNQKYPEVTHLTFRRTYRASQRIGLELDHYDRHELSVRELIEEPQAARNHLLGGGRLSALSARLRAMRTLAEFVAERGWLMGEGFIEGRQGQRPGPHLTGKPLLPTKTLTTEGFTSQDLDTVTATSFYRPGRSELFEPPLLLIREHESLPLAFWDSGPLAYKHEIVGIHCDPGEREELLRLFQDLSANRDACRLAVMLQSPQLLIARATALLKSDIEGLPYPHDKAELELTFWEQALAEDTLEHMAPLVRLGQKSELLTRTADAEALEAYAAMYCRMLGSLYGNLRPIAPHFLDGLICQGFCFGDEPAIDWLGPGCEQQLANLVFEQTLPTLRTIRVVRFYHQNVVFIIKPKLLRYWIRSTAIRDADDTLLDLRQQRY